MGGTNTAIERTGILDRLEEKFQKKYEEFDAEQRSEFFAEIIQTIEVEQEPKNSEHEKLLARIDQSIKDEKLQNIAKEKFSRRILGSKFLTSIWSKVVSPKTNSNVKIKQKRPNF